MNAGKNRPPVYGFKLSTLSRLTMQKSPKDPTITFVHGLVNAIEHSKIDCGDFTKELNFVDDASNGNRNNYPTNQPTSFFSRSV